MKKVQKKLKKLAKKLMCFVPQELPTGLSALDKYSDNIFDTWDLPALPSYRQAISSMIMNLGPTKHREAPYYFVKAVKKAMANQVAYEKIQQLRKEEKKFDEAHEQAVS